MIDISRFKQEFIDRFGRSPRIFRAPGRVNLIGEHTDYNGGFVLPFAIEQAVYVAAASRDDESITVASAAFGGSLELSLSEVGRTAVPPDWTRYPFGVVSLLSRAGQQLHGADLLIASDIPSGAGLSSSAALEVGIATALKHLFELDLDDPAIAKIGQRTENEFAGLNSGIMDQMASVLGKADHALLLDCRSLEWQHVPLENASFLVCDTRTKHSLAESEYNARRRECEKAASMLGIPSLRDGVLDTIEALPSPLKERARHVISENSRVASTVDALRSGEMRRVGELMNASHASLRDDFEVSCFELDIMSDICRAQPEVFGSRMTGGGFGGCTISLCAEDANIASLAERISTAYLGHTGIQPAVYSCRAVQGAGEIIGLTN